MKDDKNVINVDGIMRIPNDLDCDEVKVDGILRVTGNVNTGLLDVDGIMKIIGMLKADQVFGDGILNITDHIEANELKMDGLLKTNSIKGENVNISGRLTVNGNVNCEKFKLSISSKCSVKHIEGSEVIILHRKRLKHLKVETISADLVDIENVHCDTVSGDIVKIGPGCHIKNVIYNSKIEISPQAKVKHHSKAN